MRPLPEGSPPPQPKPAAMTFQSPLPPMGPRQFWGSSSSVGTICSGRTSSGVSSQPVAGFNHGSNTGTDYGAASKSPPPACPYPYHQTERLNCGESMMAAVASRPSVAAARASAAGSGAIARASVSGGMRLSAGGGGGGGRASMGPAGVGFAAAALRAEALAGLSGGAKQAAAEVTALECARLVTSSQFLRFARSSLSDPKGGWLARPPLAPPSPAPSPRPSVSTASASAGTPFIGTGLPVASSPSFNSAINITSSNSSAFSAAPLGASGLGAASRLSAPGAAPAATTTARPLDSHGASGFSHFYDGLKRWPLGGVSANAATSTTTNGCTSASASREPGMPLTQPTDLLSPLQMTDSPVHRNAAGSTSPTASPHNHHDHHPHDGAAVGRPAALRLPKIPSRFVAVQGFAEAFREARAALGATVGRRRGWRLSDYYTALGPTAPSTKGGCWRDHLFTVERELRCRRQIPHLAVAAAAVIVLCSMPTYCVHMHSQALPSRTSSSFSSALWGSHHQEQHQQQRDYYERPFTTSRALACHCHDPIMTIALSFISHLVLADQRDRVENDHPSSSVGSSGLMLPWGAAAAAARDDAAMSHGGYIGSVWRERLAAAGAWLVHGDEAGATAAGAPSKRLGGIVDVVFALLCAVTLGVVLRRFLSALIRPGYTDGVLVALRMYLACWCYVGVGVLFAIIRSGEVPVLSFPVLTALGWLLAVKALAYAIA